VSDSEGAVLKEATPTVPRFISGKDERESAKRGIATHMIMQFCDLESLAVSTRDELSRLVSSEFISKEDAQRVRIDELDAFSRSPLFDEMRKAKKLYRELRFNAKLPAERFSADKELAQKLKGRYVLVQGVIDCIIERADGSLHLVDYKTDRLTKEELASTELADKRLRRAHSLQLSYYSAASVEIFGKRPEKVGIYSLHAGREIEIDTVG
jgi:ATP-dependent helicase/nuclease subunit A